MPTATIPIPKKLLQNVINSNTKAREAAEKLEDFLLINDPNIAKQIESSKKDFASGRKISFSKL